LSDGTGVGAKSYGKSGGSVYECRQAVPIRNVQNASHERPETISNTEWTWNAATLLWDILYRENIYRQSLQQDWSIFSSAQAQIFYKYRRNSLVFPCEF
jgi:hypothetical protein